MKFLVRTFFVLILILGACTVAFAQDGAQTLDESGLTFQIQAVSGEDEAEVLANSLLTLIYNAVYLPFAAPLVLMLVSVAKRFTTVNANILSLFFAVFIWAFWVGATEIGLGGQFESVVGGTTTIAMAILGTLITPAGAGKLYSFAKEHDVALFGFERTPQTA